MQRVYFTELVEYISHCWVLILLVFQRLGVNLAFLILLLKKKQGRRLSWFNFKSILNGFSHENNIHSLWYSKNPENFRFAKTNAKQRKTQKESDVAVLSPLLDQDLVRCTNDDLTRLTREGQEIVETTCENSYIHFKLAVHGQSYPHLWVCKVLKLKATKP